MPWMLQFLATIISRRCVNSFDRLTGYMAYSKEKIGRLIVCDIPILTCLNASSLKNLPIVIPDYSEIHVSEFAIMTSFVKISNTIFPVAMYALLLVLRCKQLSRGSCLL